MDFVKCYLCGDLAVQEHVARDLTATIFCTSKLCGRYELTAQAMQALQAGASLKEPLEDVKSRVYLANRNDDRILITENELLPNELLPESTPEPIT